jgi:aminopeptidase N
MKHLTLYLLVFVFAASVQAQHHCNHKASFSPSAVADTIDAIHYDIHLQEINFENQSIQAVTQLTLRPKMSLDRIPLELQALEVESVTSNDAAISSFEQNGNILHIHLTETISETDTATISITYGGTPFHEAWGGFHFSGDYAFNLGVGFESDPHNLGKAWFPCVDDFKDRATYEIRVTLPEALVGVAGGLLTEVTDVGNGLQTWHWQINQPIPTYLASVAAGDYALVSDTYQGMNQEIPVTIYTRPTDSVKVAGSFVHLHEIMDFFEARFGPYPFDRIGYAGTAIGAMEHVTNIAYPHFAINGNLSYEYLLTHELSHMWFGNMVTCADAGDMWLNEGWATFCQYFYKHDLYNPETYRQEMNENHYDILKNAHITDGSYLSLDEVPTEYTYGTTVYDKGATVVHSLMNYLGQEVFFDAIKAYLQEFAFAPASSEDMRDFLTNYTGRDMTGFFDTWVFTPGTPHYSIDSANVSAVGDEFEVQLFLRKKHKGVDYIGVNHQFEVGFMNADWEIISDTVQFDGLHGHSIKTLPFEPILVLADPFDRTADATTDESFILDQTGEYSFPKAGFRLYADQVIDSAWFRLTHHWAKPDSLKIPVNGLRLSPYRHWEVSGINLEAQGLRGRFFYSDGASLDGSLFESTNDSVVILYRQNPADEWQAIPQYREGLWNIGYIYVEELLPGQYTLAVWDTQIVGLSANPASESESEIKAFPNPTQGKLTFRWEQKFSGSLIFTDQNGKTNLIIPFENTNQIEVDSSRWEKGLYLIEQKNLDGHAVAWTKIVVL